MPPRVTPIGSRGNPSHRDSKASTATTHPPASAYPKTIDPSPVDSVGSSGTGVTDIDQDADSDSVSPSTKHPAEKSPSIKSQTFGGAPSRLHIPTEPSPRARSGSGASPLSAIRVSQPEKERRTSGRQRSSSSRLPVREKSHHFVEPPAATETSAGTAVRLGSSPSQSATTLPRNLPSRMSTASGGSDRVAKRRSMASALDTSRLSTVDAGPERDTPKAQTREEAEEEEEMEVRGRSHTRVGDQLPAQPSRSSMRPCSQQPEPMQPTQPNPESEDHPDALIELRDGFNQCWTFCNTLSQLSSRQRKRVFLHNGGSDMQDQAWKTCWKLCQSLYESRERTQQEFVMPTLEMCRDFCQALFEARQRPDEAADSVLRVLWELQIHLYNTHDRTLSLAVHERTLEFYVALCHRLMRQRTSLPEQTEALLQACWTLAELLFGMRQAAKEGQPAGEELLSMAVQACWELCDLFRQGWNQERLDTATPTPRPVQTSFSSQVPSSREQSPSSITSSTQPRYASASHGLTRKSLPPETPTTIFEDNPMDSYEDENPPNILVLGPDRHPSLSGRHWPSSVSTTQSEASSHQTTITPQAQEAALTHLMNIRLLLVKAAMNAGFQHPTSRSPKHEHSSSSNTTRAASHAHRQTHQTQQARTQALLTFAYKLPSTVFGTQSWQTSLVDKYRKLLANWPVLVNKLSGGGAPHEATALVQRGGQRRSIGQIAASVVWMGRMEGLGWLRELFGVVFGVGVDDAKEDFVVVV